MDVKNRMFELINKMKEASEAYYNGAEIMSNFEYDAMFDELTELEKSTGIILPDSPTKKVGTETVDELPKEKHEYPALSLDKTKDYKEFVDAFRKGRNITGCNKAVLMWKLDGSTIQCTYQNGVLVKAATRGNGEIGNIITHNAPYIKGLPLKIPYNGKLVARGEATMTYREFERINSQLEEGVDKYKNPRNLATATVRLLDGNVTRTREIWFSAFNLVFMDDMPDSFSERLDLLKSFGFHTVDSEICDIEELEDRMKAWEQKVSDFDTPVDGLVAAFDDVKYASSLPGTGHNPHVLNGYAFKWADETAETVLREIEWSPSRTGLLNPVAVFDPVELEGTTVSRASLHNVSYMRNLNLALGDRITIYKANKIIPQVAENLSKDNHPCYINKPLCPCCSRPSSIIKSDDSDTLVAKCENPECSAKILGKFVHFCERDCMNIEGMSESTLDKFIKAGFLKEFADLYHLDRYKDLIISMDGFGQKSYDNIIEAVEKSRRTDFVSFVHALGIPNVGKGQAKLLSKAHNGDVMKFLYNCCNGTDFTEIEGIGEVIANSIHYHIFTLQMQSGPDNSDCEITRLLKELSFEAKQIITGDKLAGKTFVITGSLESYPNREAMKDHIESFGGKVTGSVSAKTSYLINNDITSTSGKNKKAKELNISIITEKEFLAMIAD